MRLWTLLKRWRSAHRPRRVRTPTRLQMETVECGAVALGIVLGYYGRIVSLPDLRAACGVSRDGSKASHLLKVARTYGLTAKGYQSDLEALRQTPLPCILFWQFNHFLVLEGFERDRIYINDPATGRRTITWDELNRSYTGIVLVFEPGPDFQPGGRRPGLLAALRPRLRGTWPTLLYCTLTGLLLVVPGIVLPVLSQLFIDQLLIEQRWDWLRPLTLLLILTGGLHTFLYGLQRRTLRRLQVKLALGLSSRFLWRLLHLPADFYHHRSAGELSARLRLNTNVATLLAGPLAQTLIDGAMVVIYGAVLLSYDRPLAIIGLGVAIANLLVLQQSARQRSDASQPLVSAMGQVTATELEGLHSIETLKSAALEADFFSRWASHHAQYLHTQQRYSVISRSLAVLPPLLNGLTTLLVLILGGLRILQGDLTIGMLIAILTLMRNLQTPISRLVSFSGQLQDLHSDLIRLDDVCQTPLPPPPPTTEAVSPPQGHLEFRNVTFGYSPVAPPLLKNLSFTLHPRQRLALVGPSGSGKSTIARLAAGLYQPWSGEILLDGQPLNTLHRNPHRLAFVDQAITLFSGSIRDNLTLWDNTIPETQLDSACQMAAIDDLLGSLPGGYSYALTEGIPNLSGGQRQRLELARALVHQPALLILDEATAALDPDTEARVNHNLQQQGFSCLIVAHRLSTIRDCDQILVLNQGAVIERGHHVQLWEQQGAYTQLIREPPPAAEVVPLPPVSPGQQTGHHPLLRPTLARIGAHLQVPPSSDLRHRPIQLAPHWWRQASGALLAYTQTDRQPVALLPHRQRYTLYDPSTGTEQRLTPALAATLAPDALALYRPWSPERRFWPWVWQGQGDAWQCLLLTTAAIILLGMLVPLTAARLIDDAIPNADRSLVLQWGLVLGGATLLTPLFQLTQTLTALRLETAAEVNIQAGLWDRLLQLPIGFFRRYPLGDLQGRVSAGQRIRERLGGFTLLTLLTSSLLLLNVGLLLYYSPTLAIVALVLVGGVGSLTLGVMIGLRPVLRSQFMQQGELLSLVVQLVGGVTKLQAAAAEPRAFAHWAAAYHHYLQNLLRQQQIKDAIATLNQLLLPLSTGLFFWVAARIAAEPTFSTGDFVGFMVAFTALILGILDLSHTLLTAQDAQILWERARPILTTTTETDPAKTTPGPLTGAVSLERVSFRYQPDSPMVLSEINLQIQPGAFVALVGSSGSGKSTLLRLLLGFDSPDSGVIRYDGQDLTQLNLVAVRRQLGVVLQNGLLSNTSIFNNIAGGAFISLEAAQTAAHQAGLAADLAAMPMGLQTLVGDRGSNLSGGQRQRVLIARALARQPKLLLFDEATSALDHHTQAMVTQALHQLKVTRLVIAHRLSTIRHADCIYVLDQGRIIQQGDFDTLAHQPGVFAQLMARQHL